MRLGVTDNGPGDLDTLYIAILCLVCDCDVWWGGVCVCAVWVGTVTVIATVTALVLLSIG